MFHIIAYTFSFIHLYNKMLLFLCQFAQTTDKIHAHPPIVPRKEAHVPPAKAKRREK